MKRFTIAFLARYPHSLQLVKGLIALDYVAIGFSTDPEMDAGKIQALVNKKLDAPQALEGIKADKQTIEPPAVVDKAAATQASA